MTQVILMDIEGTTTSISFVHDVLFPYARKHILGFVGSNFNEPQVQNYLAQAAETINAESNTTLTSKDWPEIVTHLIHWIDEDRKHGALKGIQGLLWQTGYMTRAYQGHIYPDVYPKWQEWRQANKTLAIYSSGSVQAQKLLFGYSVAGDLTPFLTRYFDTSMGQKRETESYTKIAKALNVQPSDILFLSDIPEELDAAQRAGFKTTQVIRPGTKPSTAHPQIHSFMDLHL